MSDFWSRKREELQKEGVLPSPKPQPHFHGPWWQVTPEPKQEPVQPYRPAQQRTEALCPHCHSENYMKPSATISARCFDCGYTAGRQLNELELPGIASPDATRLKVKQLDSGGHFGRSAAEIAQNNAVLEQSAHGKAKVG